MEQDVSRDRCVCQRQSVIMLLTTFIADIDGIKIQSDVEGGASKRSYNYRVRNIYL